MGRFFRTRTMSQTLALGTVQFFRKAIPLVTLPYLARSTGAQGRRFGNRHKQRNRVAGTPRRLCGLAAPGTALRFAWARARPAQKNLES